MKHIKRLFPILFFLVLVPFYGYGKELDSKLMNDQYWKFWNQDVQKQIDANIEKNRKADFTLELKDALPDSEVKIEQLTHSFRFGSNIFLFDQLGSPEKNKKYANIFGDLFNAATIAFYWKTLEPEEGKIRFTADSPYIYRRPPTDPVVEYCRSRNLSIHGHAIIYAFPLWGHPTWLPKDRKGMEPYFEKHIRQLAERYGDKIAEWDVVNECYDQVNRGLVPDDYVYKTFKWSEKYFPASVLFSMNETNMDWKLEQYRHYCEIARNLIDRGTKVDLVGMQAHLMGNTCNAIANGTEIFTPKIILAKLDCMAEAGRPIHISEVTVTATEPSEKGEEIQAIIAKNLYRLWFSHSNVTGITWWNAVDGGAVPNEPSYSGVLNKDLNPKPVYNTLDQLFNHEWRTNLTVKLSDTKLAFRGFRGKYRITWIDKNSKSCTREVVVK